MTQADEPSEPVFSEAGELGVSPETEPGRPTAAQVWSRIDTIPAWLDRARKMSGDPQDVSGKAAEWLLDNEYLVRRAFRQVKSDLPREFYFRLRRLSVPEAKGLPRVLLAAHEHFRATRIHVSLVTAIDFMNEYQRSDPLSVAELWAFPSMLRLACLETIVISFSDLLPGLRAPFEAIPGSVAENELAPTEAVSRAIMALKAISSTPWKDFFEATSRVEASMREDPSGTYPKMDFDSCDRYRKRIEEIAAGSGLSECDVTRKLLELARNDPGDELRSHVGWWLIDEGRKEFEDIVGYQPTLRDAISDRILTYPGRAYFTALVVFLLVAMFPPLKVISAHADGLLPLLAGGILVAPPAMIFAVAFTQWVACRLISPRSVPKLDFREGLPKGYNTVLIVPTIFGATREIKRVLERLEMHWLANPDPRLRIALLSDLADAATQHAPSDAEIEQCLRSGIEELNRRYAETSPFVLLHRRRLWNPSQACWMGWERKRGKIQQFNEFLADGNRAAFKVSAGEVETLKGIKYVVTLDSDTIAPPGTVPRLIGTLAHPLNRARVDSAVGKMIRGYTIVQPRIEISPDAGERTLFSRLYTGDTSIDIYSRAVSDLYQDLFGAGIFTGKGAYEAMPFRESLAGRVPDNALLSHDLFEGLHGRVALASDIILYEDFPARYCEFSQRWHRWVRGDWQLLPWLKRRVPAAENRRLVNSLSVLGRWKIVDNMRRSAIPPGMMLFAVAGWLALPQAAWHWSIFTILAPGAYLFTDLFSGIASVPRRSNLRLSWHRFVDHLGRWFLEVAFMANNAAVAVDAITRTLWRRFVTKKQLLEWVTAAHSARHTASARLAVWRSMVAAPVMALTIAIVILYLAPTAFAAAAPLLLLWLLSPEIALATGRERISRKQDLAIADEAYLRRVARRTWLFFETFVGPSDNWLPPDNYQDRPYEELAHRTSPTNIGMLFLSSLTALDLGHVGLRDFAVRTRHTLETLGRLERHRGHVLNWFDTRTLSPLEPRYVSTVDSGNLACCLVALRQACHDTVKGPVVSGVLWTGLGEPLALLEETIEDLPAQQKDAICTHLELIREQVASCKDDPRRWWDALRAIRADIWPELQTCVRGISEAHPEHDRHETAVWLERVYHHVYSMERDIEDFFPWLTLLESPPEKSRQLARRVTELLALSTPLDRIRTKAEEVLALISEQAEHSQATDHWLDDLRAAILRGTDAQKDCAEILEHCAAQADVFAMEMDFGYLYDRETRSFFIGDNVSLNRMDVHHYDLLASEARLASYFAIAKRDIPVEHWFHLGRPISVSAGRRTILSWNGSMFEYLMPALLMRAGNQRLTGHSEQAAVEIQKRYGERLKLPWGVSESAFASQDGAHRYQYRAFGVPGLGLRTDLAEDYVVAPYASALALAVVPVDAVVNLRELERIGATGRYGFFDALDFTPDRRPARKPFAPVRTFMAHHQGMMLASIGNALNDGIHVGRFMRDPRIRSMDLLLQERVPWEQKAEALPKPHAGITDVERRDVPTLRGWTVGEDWAPQMHVIGNGRMSSWITDAGGGALWLRGDSLTRWTADPARDEGGSRIFLKNMGSGTTWSIGRKFGEGSVKDARLEFFADRAEFHQHAEGVSVSMKISVAEADDVEIRRVSLVNYGEEPCEIEVTSYAEVVLAPAGSHERHPAFSKLFVRSDWLDSAGGLLFTRRPRRPDDLPPVMFCRVLCDDSGKAEPAGHETDRRVFMGRLGDVAHPAGLDRPLENTEGWTLDPVAVLRAGVWLDPGARRQVAFVTVASDSAKASLETARRYQDISSLDWAFDDAERGVALQAQQLGMNTETLEDAQAACVGLLLPAPQKTSVLQLDLPSQNDLWRFGISGDLPIALVRIQDTDRADLLAAAVRAHQWWRRCGLRSDLVFLTTGPTSYENPLRDSLNDVLREVGATGMLRSFGGIHVLRADRIARPQLEALTALASVEFDGSASTLSDGRVKAHRHGPVPPPFPRLDIRIPPGGQASIHPSKPAFDNGFGGFIDHGRRYLIHLGAGQQTPMPWCNILSNDSFGSIVSEAGLGFTWAVNSGEHRLTPWSSDPVADPQGEALYLRDEETGHVWTPTPAPAGRKIPFHVEHAFGSTTWSSHNQGVDHRLTVFVPPDAPVKLAVLELVNKSGRDRRLTLTYFAEWLMGALTSTARQHVACSYHAELGALLARNGWNSDFGDRVAFLTGSRQPHSITCERLDFLGRSASRSVPEGLSRWDLGGQVEEVCDPCAGYQVHVELGSGKSEEVIFVLGEGSDIAEMEELVKTWTNPDRVHHALEATDASWKRRLGSVQVSTPDPAFDILVNGWLQYQAMSSRVFARAGFYQASGGIGYRDQLQDMMALLFSEPQRVREHILESAAHQFEDGDVLHWWHPPVGRGVRTRCSDDLMWLVYVTCRYVEATGDTSILDEQVPYLSAPLLSDDEEDRYALFESAGVTGSLFDHCRRAMDQGWTAGAHGLPLIGAGDWNDGMDRVGIAGRGESVWLAWFAVTCADGFADLATRIDRSDLAEQWRARAAELRATADVEGWDGGWYVRAFDDNGEPWGSSSNEECRIDSISQSWAVLAGDGETARPRIAVEAAMEHLVESEQRLIRLLAPPFDRTERDPGYIRAYPPGIRENGGQYTHAATWLGFANAELRDGDATHRLFDLINPIRRTSRRAEAERYRGEPYVIPADIGGAAPFVGRSGWTWYTGAAGWTWRLGVEAILGLRLENGGLRIDPCLPKAWGGYSAVVSAKNGHLEVVVADPGHIGSGKAEITVGGETVSSGRVAFPIDGSTRRVEVVLSEGSCQRNLV